MARRTCDFAKNMKYAAALGMISVVFAAWAFIYPSVGVVLVWASLSFAVVAAGYAGLGSRVFGKRRDGSIAPMTKVILLPYLLYTWSVWHLCRLLSREAAFNRIGDDLVIGRRLLARELPEAFDHYVDLTSEFEEPREIRSRHGYRCVPILDASVPSHEELRRAVSETADGTTYVHCAQGHGRTGLFALALLFHRGRVTTPQEGITLLQQLRPAIRLNRLQRHFIEDYMNHNGEQSVAENLP